MTANSLTKTLNSIKFKEFHELIELTKEGKYRVFNTKKPDIEPELNFEC